jgi:hypothetical protein
LRVSNSPIVQRIRARRFRTQEHNRAEAIDRLLELFREATVRPTPRRTSGKIRPLEPRPPNAWLLLFCRETARYYLRRFAAT